MKDTKESNILGALPKFKEYLREFKNWHDDPVGVSTRKLAYSLASNEDRSSLELQRLSPFATPSAHAPLSPTGSYWLKPKLTTPLHSQSSMVQTSPLTTPASSQTTIAPLGVRSNAGYAPFNARPPFPRSAHSSSELPLLGSNSPDLLTVQRHETESLIPPQAAWARPVLQPQKY